MVPLRVRRPLDGTRENVNRTGEFTVNIASIEERAPVLGVVAAPAVDERARGGSRRASLPDLPCPRID